VEGTFSAAVCSSCGFWYHDPRLPLDKLSLVYPSSYRPHASPPEEAPDGKLPFHQGMINYLSTVLGYRHLKLKRNNIWKIFNFLWRQRAGVGLLPTYVETGRLLEIGCGDGRYLKLLRKLGWTDLHGIELIEAAAEKARQSGFVVKTGAVEEKLKEYPDGYFDAVSASMVFEHLANPFSVVKLISKKLKFGGQFLFSTITRDSFDAKIYGRYWSGYDFPRHLVYMNNADVRRLVADGFSPLETYHHNAPIDYVRSSEWRREHKESTWFDKFILATGERRLIRPFSILGFLKMTCRVSVRTRKNEN
jgi:SAM-dependent methyltransferase